MNFRLTLFALCSLAVGLATASPLVSRQASVSCPAMQKLQCCHVHNLNDGDAKEALKAANISAAGLVDPVGIDCVAPSNATEPGNLCDDGRDITCCAAEQASTQVLLNCNRVNVPN